MSSTFLTNIKYLDFKILNYLDDTSLCQLFNTNKYWAQKGQNDEYFKFRIQLYYGNEIVSAKPLDVTFKQQYFDLHEILYRHGFMGSAKIKCCRLDLILATHQQYGRIPTEHILINCLKSGQIDTVKFIINTDKNLLGDTPKSWLINQLVKYGQVELLDILVQQYQIFPTTKSFTQSFSHLNLNQLKQLYSKYKLKPTREALTSAISRGYKELIFWLVDEFGMMPVDDDLDYIEVPTNIEMFYWLIISYNLKPEPMSDVAEYIISRGDFDLAERIRTEFNLEISPNAARYSLENNNVTALSWLIQHYGIKPIALSFNKIVNNLDAVKFIITKLEYQPTIEDANCALIYNQLEVLKYLYEQFQLMPDDAPLICFYLHTTNTNMGVVKFLFEIKPQLSFDHRIVGELAQNGDLNLCQFIYDKFGLYPDEEACDIVWRHGGVHIYSWLSKIQNQPEL